MPENRRSHEPFTVAPARHARGRARGARASRTGDGYDGEGTGETLDAAALAAIRYADKA